MSDATNRSLKRWTYSDTGQAGKARVAPQAFCTYLNQIQPLIKKRVQAFARCANDL